ncbi:MAG: cytochrome c [Actinomycetota bacterium]|nr:cytochrome c [Actinomycetota bacterium]
MRRRAAFAAVLVAGLAACGGGEETRPLPEDVEGTVAQTTTQQEGGGDGEQGDASAGKEVFASAGCGSCHALSDAGTSGTVGPDLDESKPDYELAVDRVTNGKGAMPSFADQLSDKEIKDVATYVVQATEG